MLIISTTTDNEVKAQVVFFERFRFQTTELKPAEQFIIYPTEKQTGLFHDRFLYLEIMQFMPTLDQLSVNLFVATGTHTAIVTNYRPLTGSPTGGTTISEEYRNAKLFQNNILI